MAINNNATLIRRDLLSKTIKLLLEDNLVESDRIPLEMRPKDGDQIRCCIYKDRAVLKYKIMSIFGISSADETDELKPISAYFSEVLDSEVDQSQLLSVVDEACSSCKSGEYIVTNMCRGCVGRSCMMSCNKNAIEIKKGQAIIDEDKCVNCGLCQKACPYHAIIYTPVPCEESCPVKAISKNEQGKERINEDDCIYCGKCIESCPFGAVVEKSHVYHVINKIKKGEKLVAMVAPAIMGQFRAGIQDILNSIKKLGFEAVIEVAEGANKTTLFEAQEWKHKMDEGQDFMTTSCCPSYVNLVDRHMPDLKPFVSETKSPMIYTNEIAKAEFPDAQTVFIGPCLGKKHEASKHKDIDFTLNFEDIGAWMVAKGIEIEATDSDLQRNIAFNDSRTYAYSGGVTGAVVEHLPMNCDIQPQQIQGIDKQTIRQMKQFAKKEQSFNFLEVMSCEHGCVGGCSTITKPPVAKRQIDKSASTTNNLVEV